jgi:hypothetical protein
MVERCCCCLNQARRPFAARYRYSNTKRCIKEPGQFKAAARRQTREAGAGEGGYENDIRQGRRTVTELSNMREKDLAAEYDVSRDTARKARNAVSEFVENSILDK